MSVKRSNKYNYESLANAIVKQAYDDYVEALRPVAPGKRQERVRLAKQYLRDDVESFFMGEWYDTLTALPADILVKAAFTEKAKGIVYDWCEVLYRSRRRESRARRKCDFSFSKSTKAQDKNRINDSRHFEYVERVKRRKKRIKDENDKRKRCRTGSGNKQHVCGDDEVFSAFTTETSSER